MTQRQFEKLQESFALYANKETVYYSSTPSTNFKKVERKGYLMGIGVNANLGRIILVYCGGRTAIPFADVKLPKLPW